MNYYSVTTLSLKFMLASRSCVQYLKSSHLICDIFTTLRTNLSFKMCKTSKETRKCTSTCTIAPIKASLSDHRSCTNSSITVTWNHSWHVGITTAVMLVYRFIIQIMGHSYQMWRHAPRIFSQYIRVKRGLKVTKRVAEKGSYCPQLLVILDCANVDRDCSHCLNGTRWQHY